MSRISFVPVADWPEALKSFSGAESARDIELGITRMLAHAPAAAMGPELEGAHGGGRGVCQHSCDAELDVTSTLGAAKRFKCFWPICDGNKTDSAHGHSSIILLDGYTRSLRNFRRIDFE